MATVYVPLGAASEEYRESVAALVDLPPLGSLGQVRLVRATGGLYYWDGSAWSLIAATVGSITLDDIDAIVDGSSAAAGEIGEIISSDVAAASATGVGATGVFGSVTSIALTAGNWVIGGAVGFNENGAILTTALVAGISGSATGVGIDALETVVHNNLISSTSDLVVPLIEKRVNITANTTFHLNTKFFYTAGTPRHYGRIVARRYR